MKLKYDREVAIRYIRLSDAPVEESDEEHLGIVPDYDANGQLVGLELMKASKRAIHPMKVELEVA